MSGWFLHIDPGTCRSRDRFAQLAHSNFIALDGKEIEVRPAIMDSAIAVDKASKRATAVKFYEVRKGMKIVVGHQGIRVAPIQRSTARTEVFEFMSNISMEQPKSAVIH